MEVITTSLSFVGQKPVRRVRVGGSQGESYALFCQDDKVILTHKRFYDRVYMVCDAELFVQMVGLKFVVHPVRGKKVNRKEQVK